MSEYDDLPDDYLVLDDNGRVAARIAQPTYEALTQIQIIMTDNGHTGPTLVEAGAHFTTDATPAHQWLPLNKAAAKKKEDWIGKLPLNGNDIPQELINEAAFTLRPREGDPEFPMEAWWPAVLQLAARLAEKRRGRLTQPMAPGFRPVAPSAPPMPFAITSMNPAEAGMAPPGTATAPANAPRRHQRGTPKPAMPNANVTSAPSQAAG